jgi:hypothetical protein
LWWLPLLSSQDLPVSSDSALKKFKFSDFPSNERDRGALTDAFGAALLALKLAIIRQKDRRKAITAPSADRDALLCPNLSISTL